jgi:cytolysin (calcineurin-like family phosphatase)
VFHRELTFLVRLKDAKFNFPGFMCGSSGEKSQSMMKSLGCFLLLLSSITAFPSAAAAQNTPNITDPFTILTYNDSAGVCVPQRADAGAANVAGCCAAPGRRGCNGNGANDFVLPACLSLDPSLALDPYDAGVLCTLATVSVDPVVPTLGQTGTDMTFYVTSDIHFFRRTYNLIDQLTHVKVLNGFFSTGATWPAGAGIPAGTPIAKPLALIIDGDITTHGLAQDLGAFRINYERGTIPASIQYPVLFGIGNHETVSDETPENAKRMFDYLETRMGNTHMDFVSGNYSWDWQGVHMVQLNTWAGDQTSVYAHTSDGLAWLANDLKTYVGNTTKPVMLFQHYLLANVYIGRVSDATNDDFFPTDENAIDSTGIKTGQGYETFWKVIQNYNVIGMFGGHNHCLGMYSSMLSTLPVTGSLYPGVAGYGVPLDNYDDGSGGDTGDGADNVAGVGNGCSATVIDGQSEPQTAVASFLVAHVNQQYLDVSAVSWTGAGSAPYFDPAEGLPAAALACRKRINSQFIPAPGSIKVTQTGSGYTVVSSADTPAGIPVALKVNSRSGVTGYNFVDACADPTDSGTNSLYFLVNGENSLAAGTSYSVAATRSSTGSVSISAVLLPPLSGTTPASFQHTAVTAPAQDTFTVFGPQNTPFATQIKYSGTSSQWLSLAPANGNFDAYGMAEMTIQYAAPSGGFGNSSAAIDITSTSTGVIQNVAVSIAQPSLSLGLSTPSIYQGGAVIFTGTLVPAVAGVTIQFTSGSTLFGSAQTSTTGTATFNYTANTLGTFPITAAASGATSIVSPASSLLVGPPLSIAATPNPITVVPGTAGIVTISLTPFGGFTGFANVSCSSPVSYMACTTANSTATISSGPVLLAVTVDVAAKKSSVPPGLPNGTMFALLVPLSLMGSTVVRIRQRMLHISLLLALVLSALTSFTGCGKGIAPSTAVKAQVPSGFQVLTLTAVANGNTQTTTVIVNFQ